VTLALEVMRKLAARGHRVRVLSEECNRPEAEAAGATSASEEIRRPLHGRETKPEILRNC
jgi:hypothetical protein